MTERLQHEGRLAVAELKAKDLRLKMQGLRDSLRLLLDPFEAEENLKADLIASQALDLFNLWEQLKGLLAEAEAVRQVLGR